MKALLLVFAMLFGSSAMAQDFPRWELFGGMYRSAPIQSTDMNSDGVLNALDVQLLVNTILAGRLARTPDYGMVSSLSANLNRWLGVTVEGAGSGHQLSFMSGPQVSWRARRMTPFARLLVGSSHINDRWLTQLAIGGGIDIGSHRVAGRCAVDWMPIRDTGRWEHDIRVSVGAVVRF
jgi:hypothetical protein